jgi:hypothetical protein
MVTNTQPAVECDPDTVRELMRRVQAEYAEMPGLSVTMPQAQRLLCIDRRTCAVVLQLLIDRGFLRRTAKGRYIRL